MIPLLSVIYVVIFGGMFWFMSQNAKKRRAAAEEMRNSLEVGVEVVTIGGLHGIIDSIDTESHTITIDAEGIKLVFDERAIARVAENKALSVAALAPAKEEVTKDTESVTEVAKASTKITAAKKPTAKKPATKKMATSKAKKD
ncbi:MAG: preprotein translocase subunit YajC [Lactobacillaceae bacterium]|jgi:preprotein translocase subunit YajC|nr:preprotein translocase subunit YajC [Lactobacillaceae bacterium]